jgi:hypothetical protein
MDTTFNSTQRRKRWFEGTHMNPSENNAAPKASRLQIARRTFKPRHSGSQRLWALVS